MVQTAQAVGTPVATPVAATPVATAPIAPVVTPAPVAPTPAIATPAAPLTPAQSIAALQAKQDAILLEVKNSFLREQQLYTEIKALVSQRTKASVDTAVNNYHVAVLTQEQNFNQ